MSMFEFVMLEGIVIFAFGLFVGVILSYIERKRKGR